MKRVPWKKNVSLIKLIVFSALPWGRWVWSSSNMAFRFEYSVFLNHPSSQPETENGNYTWKKFKINGRIFYFRGSEYQQPHVRGVPRLHGHRAGLDQVHHQPLRVGGPGTQFKEIWKKQSEYQYLIKLKQENKIKKIFFHLFTFLLYVF